jgi:hypothetical protein
MGDMLLIINGIVLDKAFYHKMEGCVDVVTSSNLDEPGPDLLYLGGLQRAQARVALEAPDNFRHRPLV